MAPDGNVYFYDRAGDVDSILYFDPGQPVTTNSLMTFLTEAEVKAGPAGPAEVNISALNTFAGKLTWHHIDRWYDLYAKPLAGPALSPADFDGDGDVDLTDYAHLAGCIAGPNQPPASPGCCSADLDKDRNVDLADFAWFQTEFP